MTAAKIVKINPVAPEQSAIKEAAQILADGGLVIIPTETVYGIAANLLNKNAVDRLYEIKQRPKDKPFSVHIDDKSRVSEFAKDIPVLAYKLMNKFWPGPLTLILESKDNGTIGLRVPDDLIAQQIIAGAGVPVVCPSANISGKPAPVNFQEALIDLNNLVDYAVDSGNTNIGLESSIVDLTVFPPQILRIGAINKEEIEAALMRKTVLFVCTGNSCRSVMAKAWLEKKLRDYGRTDVDVLSAGVMLSTGLRASDSTIELLSGEGLDVSSHRSKSVTAELINKSDIILLMEKSQEAKVLELAPDAKNRVFLLKEFAKIKDNNLEIEDPAGRSIDFYQDTFNIIKEAVDRIVEII